MNKLPEAIFDTLFIGNHVQARIEDFNILEVQSLAYLSCLISLYDKNPIAFWRYNFIKSELSSPYSLELHSTLLYLSEAGYLDETSENYFKLTLLGKGSLDFYQELESFKERKKYLSIACDSINIIPLNLIKNALKNDHILSSASLGKGRKLLLVENSYALTALYEDFFNLRTALEKDYSNLFAPAIVWLQSLINEKAV